MSTDLPRQSSEQLSGIQSQFKRTVLKRGSATISLSQAVTNSTGFQGSTSIDITDTYIATTTLDGSPTFVLPKAEVSSVLISSGSGLPTVVPFPYTQFTTSNAIEASAYHTISYSVSVVPTERVYVYLNIFLRMSSTMIAAYTSTNTIYYTIYSEGSYAFDNWNYKS